MAAPHKKRHHGEDTGQDSQKFLKSVKTRLRRIKEQEIESEARQDHRADELSAGLDEPFEGYNDERREERYKLREPR